MSAKAGLALKYLLQQQAWRSDGYQLKMETDENNADVAPFVEKAIANIDM